MAATTTAIAKTEFPAIAQEKPVGQWGLAWRRLRRHRLAMIGMVVLTVIVISSLAADWIAPYAYDEIDLHHTYAQFMSPGMPGRAMHYLGADALGRDAFTR